MDRFTRLAWDRDRLGAKNRGGTQRTRTSALPLRYLVKLDGRSTFQAAKIDNPVFQAA
jgi:hypothetical protein